MDIREFDYDFKLSEKREYACVCRDGKTLREEQQVLSEHSAEVYINGKRNMKLTCSPQYLTELVLGHLYTEGLVEGVCDIEAVSWHEDGKKAEVVMREKPHAREMKGVRPMVWKPEWIFRIADHFAEGMPLHRKTWATHSCFLAREDKILFECEDIGRHNAFDKVIGYALRNGIDLTKCIAYSSGRIPVDMAEKAVMAGIPVLAAKAVPTIEALRLAEEYHLTLVGAGRTDRMKVYTSFAGECR